MQLNLNENFCILIFIVQEKRKKHNKDQNVKYKAKREEIKSDWIRTSK